MKHSFFFLSLFFFVEISFSQHCLSHIQLNQKLRANPELLGQIAQMETQIREWQNVNINRINSRTVVTIPVVVHVVWNQEEENISEEQIQSQIDVLNQDFRRLNTNLDIVPFQFEERIADLELEFCLKAITRTKTEIVNIGFLKTGGKRAICYTDMGGRDAWDTQKYLNIWLGRSEGVLGEASFPGMDIPEEDGVRIDPRYFGTTGIVAPPYNLGRTTTHEIGHFFNLKHLWGSGLNNLNCTDDDEVMDTPLQAESYRGKCPSPTDIFMSCGDFAGDMTMNFMNYTDDACLAMFTTGQKNRVWASINNFRQSFLQTPDCTLVNVGIDPKLDPEIKLLQNPAKSHLKLEINIANIKMLQFSIVNLAGQILLQKTIHQSGIHQIPISQLGNGLYLINVWHKEKFTTKKLIIAK